MISADDQVAAVRVRAGVGHQGVGAAEGLGLVIRAVGVGVGQERTGGG
ncbi:MAG: hypothetical protein U1F77_01395 [Kiritimatiellia bacterium]